MEQVAGSIPAGPILQMKIGIISDIHYGPIRIFKGELMGDGRDALGKVESLLIEMKKQGVELLVDLGDNISEEPSYDKSRISEVRDVFYSSGIPTCFILGNHELTTLTKKDSMEALSLPKSYYAIDLELEKLIFLDAQDGTCSGLIGNEQLNWLEGQLSDSHQAYVFVHQSLAESDLKGNKWFEKGPAGGYVKNKKEVRKILEKYGNVKLVVNGHLHQSRLQLINDLEYCTLGSWSEFKSPGVRCEYYNILETRNCGLYFFNNPVVHFDETLSD